MSVGVVLLLTSHIEKVGARPSATKSVSLRANTSCESGTGTAPMSTGRIGSDRSIMMIWLPSELSMYA